MKEGDGRTPGAALLRNKYASILVACVRRRALVVLTARQPPAVEAARPCPPSHPARDHVHLDCRHVGVSKGPISHQSARQSTRVAWNRTRLATRPCAKASQHALPDRRRRYHPRLFTNEARG